LFTALAWRAVFASTAMKKGHSLNNGENHNHFPLARRPSSAVEKAAPGAKRVLSGMVADTLALVKTKPVKPVLSILVCGGIVDGYAELFEAILRPYLDSQYNLKVSACDYAVEIIRLAEQQSFDLFIVILNNVWQGLDKIHLDAPDGGMWGDRIMLLKRLKAQFGKPIIALSGIATIEMSERSKQAGADVFFPMPFDVNEFLPALETTLKIKIPRDLATPDEIISLKSRPLNRRGKLLVVDDEEGVRESMRVIFENEYDLFMAEDGLTAIELAKQNDIDVAVLDICMAVMSGLEVLERLKILKPDIEVIMMSGYGTNDCIRESFRLGASDYINKPFDISTIRAAVSKAMQHCTLRKRNTPKLSIAVCGHCDESFCEWLGAIFHELLSKKYTVKIEPFIFADELFEAAQGKPFDLFIVFLNPRLPRKVDAHELVATLKRQFQKPILILTNEIIYGLDSAAGFKQAGADAFFSFMPPFPPAGFKEALEKCVSKNQQT